MIYAQFYEERNGELVECIASSGLIIIDGRLSSANQHAVALKHCNARKKAAYQLMQGSRLDNARPISTQKRV